MERSTESLIRSRLGGLDGTSTDTVINFLKDPASAIFEPRLYRDPGSQRELYGNLVDALREVASLGVISEAHYLQCPECSLTSVGDRTCDQCGVDFDDNGLRPIQVVVFKKTNFLPTRDVRWVILIHGMNTVAQWQQLFGWRMSMAYGYSIPVSIFKYGILRLGVLFGFRIETIVNSFETHLEKIFAEMKGSGVGRPDLIAHSLGTLIFCKLLERGNPNLSFGRVILCGGIVPQNFDWTKHVGDSIDLVLNHCGGKDIYPKIAQFVIPASGPSGSFGFLDERCLNIQSDEFGHSTFLDDSRLAAALKFDGLWRNFLVLSDPKSSLSATFADSQNKTAPAFVRWAIRNTARALIIALVLIISLVPFGAAACIGYWLGAR